MIEEGDRVRIKTGSALADKHPELRDAIGVVSSIVRKASLTDPAHSAQMHVRFRDLNVIAFNVSAADLEPVSRLSPELRAV